MLSSRNKPSGSFLPTAYHWPAYYQRYKVYQNSIQQQVLHHSHPHHSSTYPWFVKVLHDRYVGHLAVLSPGHCQEAEGHKVAQHSTSQKKKSTWKEVSLLYYHFNISFRIRHILMKQQLTQYWSIQKKKKESENDLRVCSQTEANCSQRSSSVLSHFWPFIHSPHVA